ncbi:MAG: hypothetical protein BM556_01470 [Bacteriovorax sp. MedPE-SWde]|nr:MAG: hypothetical protein BM556_01470 [Bacteriovorax sp. MedPE-SWde]
MSQKKSAIIIDLDGTLTNCDHRVHHLNGEIKDWDSFYGGLGEDDLHDWCKELMCAMSQRGHELIIVTGREEKYKEETKSWLERHDISYSYLYMRNLDDHRSDSVIKSEVYNNYIVEQYNILFVLDDRKSVVKMWRDLGLVCLQCDWGEF